MREELRDVDDRAAEATDIVSDLSFWAGEVIIVVARCRAPISG